MDRLIRRMGRSPRRVRALAQVRRAAAVALVFLAVGFSGLMVTSQAFRAQVLEVLVQVYEEITNFRFSAEGETDRTAGDFVLTYLPQGMEETVRQSSRIRHYICFEDNAGNMLEVTHRLSTSKSITQKPWQFQKIWIILFFGPKTTATICCPGPFLWKS